MKKNTGKAPSVQLYYKDLYADIIEHPNDIVGAWMKLLCKIWHAGDGQIVVTWPQLARIIGESVERAKSIIIYLHKQKVADIEISGVTDNDKITIVNRRAKRDCKLREQNRLRQKRHRGNAQCNADVTDQTSNPSSSPSSSTSFSPSSNVHTEDEHYDPFGREIPQAPAEGELADLLGVWADRIGDIPERISALHRSQIEKGLNHQGFDWCKKAMGNDTLKELTSPSWVFSEQVKYNLDHKVATVEDDAARVKRLFEKQGTKINE